MSMKSMTTLLHTLVFTLMFFQARSVDLTCPCTKLEQCKRVTPQFKKGPEVYVFSRDTTNVHLWMWSTIDTMVVPVHFNRSDPVQSDTMCSTHAQGKKFGITVEYDVLEDQPGKIDTIGHDPEQWRVMTYLKHTEWSADVITVDLLPYFRGDKLSSKKDHQLLAIILYRLKQEIKNVEIICIVPWKPPCSKEEGACDFATLARDGCDSFLLNPDSFLDTEDVKCMAQANIPLTKLLYGISEYTAHHIPPNRIILGVTWHGYDYKCQTLTNDVCSLQDPPKEDNTTKEDHTCHFKERKRISYGDIIRQYSNEFLDHTVNKMYDAPFFNYKDGSVNHQIWFEDEDTLKAKYRLAVEIELKGIAILYGDDLSPTKPSSILTNDGLMWTWLAHEMMLKESTKPKEHKDLHWADTVAGVAVGCFLLGTLLGVIFSCISMQKRVKKPRAPFRSDMDPLGSDYTDDPDL